MAVWLLVAAGLLVQTAPRPALSGTVVDTAGKPIVAARVDVASAGPKDGSRGFCPTCYLDCAKSARTDAQGRFQIAELDRALSFRVLISARGKRSQLTVRTDPAAAPLRIALADVPKDVPPERLVLGEVVDEQGLPIEGAIVEPWAARTADKYSSTNLGIDPSVTDGDGRFALFLPAGYLAVDVTIPADGHAGDTVRSLAPGAKRHCLVVPLGARVTGRLVQAGLPAAGLLIAVVQRSSVGKHFVQAVTATTDTEGRFVIDYLPASQGYAIFSVVGEGPQPLVLTTKKLQIPASGQERNLGDLEVVSSLRLAGRVEMPAGMTLPPDAKVVLNHESAWDLISTPLAADGSFEFRGLPPERCEVTFALGEVQIVAADFPYQLTHVNAFGIRLRESVTDLRIPLEALPPAATRPQPAPPSRRGPQPPPAASSRRGANVAAGSQTLRGRVVTFQGEPVPDMMVSAYLPDGLHSQWINADGRSLSTTTTRGGYFELKGLPDEPIELAARRRPRESGPILYPAFVRPPLNASNIRIRMDPALLKDIEDLDPPRK